MSCGYKSFSQSLRSLDTALAIALKLAPQHVMLDGKILADFLDVIKRRFLVLDLAHVLVRLDALVRFVVCDFDVLASVVRDLGPVGVGLLLPVVAREPEAILIVPLAIAHNQIFVFATGILYELIEALICRASTVFICLGPRVGADPDMQLLGRFACRNWRCGPLGELQVVERIDCFADKIACMNASLDGGASTGWLSGDEGNEARKEQKRSGELHCGKDQTWTVILAN
jgi:hypothetical protein